MEELIRIIAASSRHHMLQVNQIVQHFDLVAVAQFAVALERVEQLLVQFLKLAHAILVLVAGHVLARLTVLAKPLTTNVQELMGQEKRSGIRARIDRFASMTA